MHADTAIPTKITSLDRIPVMVVSARHVAVLDDAGEIRALDHGTAANELQARLHLVANLPLVERRLGLTRGQRALDALELFAFVRPARFCLPTVAGLAEALTLPRPQPDLVDQAVSLRRSAQRLLADMGSATYRYGAGAGDVAMMMGRGGWPWAPLVLAALGLDDADAGGRSGMAVWHALTEWEEGAPPSPPDDLPVTADEAQEQLTRLLAGGAEARPAQRDYARVGTFAFSPRENAEAPNLQLAEAGTGTGKTLGYIAPASVWAAKNGGAVWLSTYTKNLQRQIDQELVRLFPDPRERHAKTVLRKGRENYLCLLNMEEAARAVVGRVTEGIDRDKVLMGLVARWTRFTRDGDMIGGDFPSWLGMHFGRGRIASLTDHRGECLYAACQHYRKCFIEKATRRARRAQVVVANHALVMQLAATRQGDPDLPKRLVFDEGHHLFDAADSAFSGHMTGMEGAELRRWLLGKEGGGRSRARGLRSRLEDLVGLDPDMAEMLSVVLNEARPLPAQGWAGRLAQVAPVGECERFLTHVRALILARAANVRDGYSIECPTNDPPEALLEAADAARGRLLGLARPLGGLATKLVEVLDEEAASLDSGQRGRLEAAARSLTLRAQMVRLWAQMLEDLKEGKPDDAFVDWFELDRIDGRERDVGLHRHWIDPTQPFADVVLEPLHGALITSATLRDRSAAAEDGDWRSADVRSGASHLVVPPRRFAVDSPFAYAEQARVFVVNDLNKADIKQVATAYRELFLSAGGGALGLFTSIARLRGTYERLAEAIDDAGLPLYAQHVDPIDVGTLVDIFRDEPEACLLGTDAVRDGVDVPGDSLRLIVFDRVPWPRPTLLHKARKQAFGPRTYDDLLTRLKLNQAFGRLIRKASDRGVFVMLDGQCPTRLLSAFPPEVPVERVGLAEAITKTTAFLQRTPADR